MRKIPKKLQEEVDRHLDTFIHYLKGYIMVAGGVEMSSDKLKNMTVIELFDTCCPNDIRFGVLFRKLKPEFQRHNIIDAEDRREF